MVRPIEDIREALAVVGSTAKELDRANYYALEHHCAVLSEALDELAALRHALGETVVALEHVEVCGSCAEESWGICEGGRQAEAALTLARAHVPGRDGDSGGER